MAKDFYNTTIHQSYNCMAQIPIQPINSVIIQSIYSSVLHQEINYKLNSQIIEGIKDLQIEDVPTLLNSNPLTFNFLLATTTF